MNIHPTIDFLTNNVANVLVKSMLPTLVSGVTSENYFENPKTKVILVFEVSVHC